VLPFGSISRHELAQILLYLDGRPLDLKGFPCMQDMYACRTPEVLLMAGRQVTKSTTIRNMLLLDACLNDYFDSLYVVPLKEQAVRFSNYYLDRGIRESPILRKWRFNSTCINNVFSKSFTNGSVVQLTYAGDDADRSRGIPNDEVFYDEAQDLLPDVIPVINESLSASPYKWRVYSGTPKTMDGTLQKLWERSSQHHWVMPCPSCRRFNVPDRDTVYAMLQPRGLSCVYCKAFLNVRKGFWQPMHAAVANDFLGFHLPQVILPHVVEYNKADPTDRPPDPPRAWREIIKKYRIYPPGVFANEVLGFSYALGGRLITLKELMECCQLPPAEERERARNQSYQHVCMGIDWGVSAETSYTVATIGGLNSNGRTCVLEIKKFYGTDIISQLQEIAKLAKKWEVEFIGADHGVGNTNNQFLRQMLGVNKILEFQYVMAKKLMVWTGQRFSLDRTTSLNLLFFDMKRKFILFPPADEMTSYFEDILSLYEQVSEGAGQTRKIFMRNPAIPDDFAHSLNFLVMTIRRASGNPIINLKIGENIYEEMQAMGIDIELHPEKFDL